MEFNKLKKVPSLADIQEVEKQLQGVVKKTPLEFSAALSARFEANIFLKREDLQGVRSYKIRGAYHKILNLPESIRGQGVVAASAGNHAQGVAFACAKLHISGHIFMPKSTPLQKVEAVRFFGEDYVRIYLVGQSYDEAFAAARKFCAEKNAIFIPPFDDFDIIAGQATVTLEIIEQLKGKHLDYLVGAVGGGGLIAGAALVLNEMSPKTNLIGTEPIGALSMTESLKHGQVTVLDSIDQFVDGASVKQVGAKTFAIIQDKISRMLGVEKSILCQSMMDLYDIHGMIVEPAGALSVAALPQMKDSMQGKTIVCIISGGNFDPKRFPEIKALAENKNRSFI